MRTDRRTLLKAGGVGVAALALPSSMSGCDVGLGFPVNSNQDSAGKVLPSRVGLPAPFRRPLPIPPVLQPTRTDATTDYYQITQRRARARILPGLSTTIWGYEGRFPGPTIHARAGRETVVRQRNELPVPTVVHLHGGRTPSRYDGYPTDYVLPVGGFPYARLYKPGLIHHGEFAYRYPLDQRAATLWYHDHRMDYTGPSVWRGLAGFFLVHDEVEDNLPLPRGQRDLPLMIVDRSFAADGSLQYPSRDPSLTHMPGVTPDYMSGVLGDCILVNGAPWPLLEVAAVRYRFRILNASNARRYRLALDPPPVGPSFTQIGSGQGLLDAPVGLDAVDIAQAERFDLIIDFSAYPVGTTVRLLNQLGEDRAGEVMAFKVVRSAADHTQVPATLSQIQPLSASDVAARREFVFAKGGARRDGMVVWTINGKPFDPNRIDARVQQGCTEEWTIRALNLPHPFHVHEDAFQVIGANGAVTPGPYDSGWKDVVNLDSGGTGVLRIRFDGYRGKYVFHCHNLEHEDMEMMANFEIV